MKTVTIYFSRLYYLDSKEGNVYKNSYFHLSERLHKKGIQLIIVSGRYRGSGRFAKGLQFVSRNKYKRMKNIKADLILNHGASLGFFKKEKEIGIVNDPEMDVICRNKWLTYKTFPDISPKTFFVKNKKMIADSLAKINNKVVVYKPLCGDNSIGIYIGSKSRLNSDVLSYPGVIQELIDTRNGIPGITTTRSEMRIFVLNGKIQFSYVCILKTNKDYIVRIENARRKQITISKIPRMIINIVKRVDDRFSQYKPRMYAIDIGYGPDGPKIIELNSRAAIGKPSQSWYQKSMQAFENLIGESLR